MKCSQCEKDLTGEPCIYIDIDTVDMEHPVYWCVPCHPSYAAVVFRISKVRNFFMEYLQLCKRHGMWIKDSTGEDELEGPDVAYSHDPYTNTLVDEKGLKEHLGKLMARVDMFDNFRGYPLWGQPLVKEFMDGK